MAALLTLICPVYKASAHIPPLIDSLIQAINSEEVHVVFVDDASPDDAVAKGQAHLQARAADIRFTSEWLIQPVNQGVAAARNRALDQVQTPYIGMVDADDLLAPGYWATLRPLVQEGGWDIIEFGFQEFTDQAPPQPAAAVVAGAHTPARLPSSQLNPFDTGFFSWSRLYAASLLAAPVRYPRGSIYEDVHFVAEAFARSRRSVRIDAVLLFYRRHPGSITARRDRHYADQMRNLVGGALAGLPHFQAPAQVLDLLTKRCFFVLLKGLRIREADEQQAFLAACVQPLSDLAHALPKHPVSWRAKAWLWACRRLLDSKMAATVVRRVGGWS